MTASDRVIELLRCFYYTALLPVRLYYHSKPIYSLPEDMPSVDSNSLLDAPVSSDVKGLQYISTDVYEHYILFPISAEGLIIVGPFLTEAVPQYAITELMRKKRVSFRYKAELLEHFNSLTVISEQRHFYCGKLLEALFSDSAGFSSSENSPQPYTGFIDMDFRSRTNDYRAQQFSHSPYAVEQEICRTISNGNTLRAKSILEEINRHPRARLAGNNLRSLKNSIICSCTFMARAAISGGVNPDDAFTLSDTYIQRIEECSDFGMLLKFEDIMISGYTAAVNSVRRKKYSNAVNQALTYIDAHLCEPLSVAQIAGAVYLNPNYLSGIFSNETGETIHSCIVRRRIEEAAYFVKNGSDSLAEIAAFYQFSSQSHFVQSFKKIMGITPGSYRRGNATADVNYSFSVDNE